ncbi:hypothetical protein ACDA63_07685 [Uliginosibacterium sp. sgz301328]|uniref:hypothetical protein n=1 Tax=Uliginosibacterium sp. sgz301328 TaxID=3243764 RepID=UPI00359CFF8A
MEQWKREIVLGNRDFEARDFIEALLHYRRALAVARRLFAHWPDADEAVAALIIAHHNMADLLRHMSHIDEAASHLCSAHRCLQQAIIDPHLPDALREAAKRHTPRTLAELQRFSRECCRHPDVIRALASRCAQCPRASRLLH